MINLKNITELPVAESTDGLNLIVNDNGAAKQVPASAVGKVKTVNGVEPDDSGNIKINTTSSWNDLKDKPFYDARQIERITIFERDNVSNSLNEQISTPLVAGETYIVTVFDNEYECVALAHDNGAVYIGSLNYSNEWGEDNRQEPFFFAANTLSNGTWMDLGGDFYNKGESSFKVEHCNVIGEIKKLDAKYLPPTYDFVIVANNNYTAELVVGDYDTIYNKLINGEFVDGKVIVYYWTGEDESTNHFSISRTFSEFEIEIGVDGNDVPSIHFKFMNNGDSYYCTIRNDNAAYYWSVD